MRYGGVRALALTLSLVTGACAAGPSRRLADPSDRMRAAYAALERDDFANATQQLWAVTYRCEQDEETRRALLVLAAAKLDTGNPTGSPHDAARLTEVYLGLPDTDPPQRVLARTLHRMAVLLEASSPSGPGGDYTDPALAGLGACVLLAQPESVEPPDMATDTASAPWARAMTAHSAALRRRVHELEAEIERITQLLTDGTASIHEDVGR